jgi:hypothetical protein
VRPLVVTVEDRRTGATSRYAFLRPPVRLGRGEDSDIALSERFVSAAHGLFQFDAEEVRYTDLGSRNGSTLDGSPLEPHAPALLQPRSELRIGPLRLTFTRGETAEAATSTRAGIAPGTVTSLMEQLALTPELDAAHVLARSLRPGLVVGRFELMREIGRGGFGIVYEARDLQLGRRVAFKAVRPREHAQDRLREGWLQREAEAAAQLSHPNIVTLHDAGSWEGGPYLILELLRGEPLDARLERGPLPTSAALDIALDVARALAHAHAHGVVHRDLKPSNVFLTEGGWAKVLDFGLAQVFGGERRLEGGTPRYMAPEQLRGEEQDARTDVYAAALVLFESLTQRLPPFHATQGGSAPVVLPGVPPTFATLLQRALSPLPRGRPADGGAWLAELLAMQREVTPTSPETLG